VRIARGACRLAGIDNARIHDLRHSYASVAVASGVGLYLTGNILGHARNTTTERYAHLADDPVRQANDVVGRRIEDAMNTPPKRTGLGTTP
jgi:site-specific recombinase XerD